MGWRKGGWLELEMSGVGMQRCCPESYHIDCSIRENAQLKPIRRSMHVNKHSKHLLPPSPMSLPPPPTPIPRVSYISSPSLLLAADSLPSNPGRATLVHSLIVALGLLQPTEDDEGEGEGEEVVYRGNRARLVRSEKCTREDLTAYHDEEFVGELHPPHRISSSDACVG